MGTPPSTGPAPRTTSAGAALSWGHAGAQALAACLLTVIGGLAAWSVLPALLPAWSSDVVLSGSMAPRFRAGDVVVAGPVDPDALEPGRLVIFEDPARSERTVLHRVVRRLPDGSLITRGDANPSDDSTPVPPELVEAAPRLRVPWIGLPVRWVHEGEALRLATAALASLACVALLALGAPGGRQEEPRSRLPWDRGGATVAAGRPPASAVALPRPLDVPAPGPPRHQPFWCARIPPHADAHETSKDGSGSLAGRSRPPARGVAAALVLLVVVGPVAPGTSGRGAHATFRAETTNGVNEFVAATSFPTYLEAVLAGEPLFLHRLDEAWSTDETSTMTDASAASRSGTFDGRTAGPSTHYRYDDGGGSEVRDASGNANPAALHGGAAWSTAGCFGRGLTLTANAYGQTEGPASRTDRSFTVATWVRLSATDADRTLVSQDGGAIAGFALHYRRGTGRFGFGMPRSDSQSASIDYLEAGPLVQADTWYHVAGVFRPDAGTMRLHVTDANGTQASSLPRTAAWNATGAFQLGRVFYEGRYQFEGAGTLADTRVYRRALSADEIGVLAHEDCQVRDHASPFSAGQPGAPGGSGATAVAFGGVANAYNDERLTPGDTFSVELWFRTTSRRGGELIGFHDTPTGATGAHDRTLFLDDDGRLTFGVEAGGDRRVATTTAAYDDGEWHHVVGTAGPATGLRLYVDGVEVATGPDATSATAFDGHWRLGGGDGVLDAWPGAASSGYVAATLDEVSVYDRVLNAQEVAWRHRAATG
jgi:signal peptidase I